MPSIDFLVNQVQEKGWLAVSSLYFDNALVANVFTSNGRIAYSPSMEMFFVLNCLDSTDTSVVENKYIVMDRKYHGMQFNLTVVGLEHLQHYDMALYCHPSFFNDTQEKMPVPKIPTEAELKEKVKDEETGLYSDTDTATLMDMSEQSCIPIYDVKETDNRYSGARVDAWKTFYENHEKFKTYLNEAFGVSDAI